MSVIRQPSLFGADVSTPEPADLAGLLIAGGQLARRDDATGGPVQISVIVDHPWRATALVGECGRRGIAATSVATPAQHIAVRTAYSSVLAPVGQAWTAGAAIRVPRGLRFDGRILRLWLAAAGRPANATSYLLPAGALELADQETVGAALAMLGLGAQLAVARRSGGVMYRIVGKRRLDRLVELIGDPPKQAPAGFWPS